jgi:hypothetical protein
MPLVGGLARARLGGQAGTARVNLLAGVFPYTEAVVGAEDQPDDATAYQRITGALRPLGLQPNPVIQSLAYVTGQDYKAPGNLSRTAGLEALPEAVPPLVRAGARIVGRPDLADRVPDLPTLPTGRALLDAAREKVTGKAAPTSDPTAKRYAELVLAATHKPLQDASNRHYLETMGDRDNGLWQLALVQTRTAGAVGNATGLISPVPTTARSVEAASARAAAPLPYTSYQISQAPKAAQSAMLAANAAATRANPASATYTNIGGKSRTDQLISQWELEHIALKRVNPAYYAQALKALYKRS